MMTSKREKLHSPAEVEERYGVPSAVIVRFISFAWIEPCDSEQHLLDAEDIARAHLIWQLQTEFGVNDQAVPIILSLIDQLHCQRKSAKLGAC